MSTEGAMQGAGAGATIGSIIPGVGTLIGGGVGGVLGGLFGKKKKAPTPTPIDITGILAEIDKMYDIQNQATQANMAKALTGQNKETSDSLAGRGIYSSPVSEWSFERNRASNNQSLADALASIAGNRASSRANVMSGAQSINAQQDYAAKVAKYQADMESRNLLTGLLMNMGASAAKASFSPKTPNIVKPTDGQITIGDYNF